MSSESDIKQCIFDEKMYKTLMNEFKRDYIYGMIYSKILEDLNKIKK